MIKHVIFDLDETLVQWSPRYVDFLCQTIERLQPLSLNQKIIIEHDIHEFWVEAPHIHEELSIQKNTDSYVSKFVIPILIKNGIYIEKDDLIRIFHHFDDNYMPVHKLYEDVIASLRKIADLGMQISILTNRNIPIDQMPEVSEISDHIHKIFIAGEIGYWKPDSKVFTYVLEKLCTRPNECVYVGDNYFVDVIGSRRVGMHAILLDRKGIYQRDKYNYIVAELNNAVDMLEIL